MSELVGDCPRCGSTKITFDLTQQLYLRSEYGWQQWYEAFCVCRHCQRGTIFVLSQRHSTDHKVVHTNGLLKLPASVNQFMDIESYVGIKDHSTIHPPEHLPDEIKSSFKEAAVCYGVGCYNAAGTMLRLCVDIATRALLPKEDVDGLSGKTRRDLGLRLPWLFANGKLPEGLKDLASCIKDDGNDGAHEGTLTKKEAEDLLEFTYILLERLYTEPQRLRIAKQRRDERHGK